MKKEILTLKKKTTKKANALLDVDKLTIDTGIADLSLQHDHHLYGVPGNETTCLCGHFCMVGSGNEADPDHAAAKSIINRNCP